ncbi:MAG: L,D-transpeptidase family protein, partial [Coriobacteriaceae bacterium]|nr:L,D-transpeptidase family protein [Coriobacteriaceae bacterium]
FITADGKSATVSGGTYGWQIDQAAEVAAIKEAITSHMEQVREPFYLQTAAVRENPDWGDTFVEINLTTQYLYYVQDGQIVLESDVVTGAPWGGRSTASGVYDVLQKSSPAVLRGPRTPDGGYEWDAPVSFWIRITWGGIGMHDANWQPRFGGDWYLYNGSHGCINMPWSNVQQLYNMIELGTPVILHY